MAVARIPADTSFLAAAALARVDYGDAFSAALVERNLSVDAIVMRMFGRAPAWMRLLMGIRDAVVGAFGLKTMPHYARVPERLDPGVRFGLFRITERGPDEIVLGEDDRHLDFRVSVRVRRDIPAPVVDVATFVHFHNPWGRAYFAVVKPFHRSVVRAILRRSSLPITPGQTVSG